MKEGWEIKDLGSVCHVQRGLTYSGKDTVDISDQVVLRATNIDLGTGKLIFDELKYLREDLEIKPIYSLKKNSLLICFSSGSKSHLGKIALVDDDYPNFYFGGFIGQINPSDEIDSKYLFYCLSSEAYKDYISNLTDGVNINNLKANDLKAFQIPLPPLPEQQRIVSILDKAFAAIAKAKANAEQNLQNAKELFESYLQGVFEKGDWDKVKLSEITTSITDGDHMPPPKSELGLPFITISNINKQAHQIDFSDTFKVPQKYYDNLKPNRKPIKNDVLYTVTGSYGIPVLIEDDFQFCFQRHIGLIRPSNKLDSKLLYYWILSPQAFQQANETATGTAQKTVSLKSLRNFSFPNIPLEEQQTIVRQLDALRAETQKLEAVYQKKIDDLEELKKSILQKAFSGQLSESRIMAD